MEINWAVEDGFVNNGSHSFDVSDEEIKECGTVENALEMIEQQVRRDFNDKVSWCFSGHDDMRAEVERLIAEREAEPAED